MRENPEDRNRICGRNIGRGGGVYAIPGVERTEDELSEDEPEQGAGQPHHGAPDNLGHGVILQVDPAVGHQQPRPQAGHHRQALPGGRVGQPEEGEEDEVAGAEPGELTVAARHPELLKLD